MSSRRPVTMADVARKAGVSRAAVSFALSGTGRLSEETRQRVVGIADELGFVANVGARNLRKATAGAIGVYLPPASTALNYYMDVIFGAIDRAQENDLAVTVLAGGRDPAAHAHVDGYVVIDPSSTDPGLHALMRGRLPVVSGEPMPADLPTPAGVVSSDHAAGMRDILQHLAAQGATRTALIAPPEDTAWGSSLVQAYLAWSAERGTPAILERSSTRFSPGDVRDITTRLLHGDAGVDAIVAGPDGSAIGAVSSVRQAGLVVGRDVLVAGYADSGAMQLSDPPITAMDLAPRLLGHRCVSMLLEILAEPDVAGPRSQAHAISLNPRRSTGVASSAS